MTESAPKKTLLFRLLLLLGAVVALAFLLGTTWLASRTKVTRDSCPFFVTSDQLRTTRSFSSYQPRTCLELGKASTTADRAKGLSGRESLPFYKGLLFEFETEAEQCMWMKDMKFSIDMIWLDRNKSITHIEHRVSPDTYPESFCGNGDAMYVIEVKSGVAESARLQVGSSLRF